MFNDNTSASPAASSTPLQRRRKLRFELKVLLVVALLVGGRLIWLYAARGPRLPTVSSETTHVTEPLTPDGAVDYLAAYNARDGAKTARQDNAAISLAQLTAYVNCRNSTVDCDRLLAALDAAPVPSTERLRVDEFLVISRPTTGKTSHEPDYDKASRAPWRSIQWPAVARLIENNQQTLDRIVEASRLPRYFVPRYLVPPGRSLSDMGFPDLIGIRAAVRMLSTRGMMRLGEGNPEGAHQDFMACHRLARLVVQEPMLVAAINGSAIENVALRGHIALAHYGRLSRQELVEYRRRIRGLPPLPPRANACWGDRLVLLESMSSTVAGRINPMHDSRAGVYIGFAEANEVVRTGNEAFDDLVQAMTISSPANRDAEVARICDIWQQRSLHSVATRTVLSSVAIGSPRQFGRHLGIVMVALALPPPPVANEETHLAQLRALTDLAWQLAEYRLQHGGYPESLESLEPQVLTPALKELFGGQLPPYRRVNEGYTLRDPVANATGDSASLVIEMPIPEKAP